MATRPSKKVKLPAGSAPIPITALAPDPKNPRSMSDDARAGLSASLEEFGPLDIVFNTRTGQLVSGHQRIKTLKQAGATEVVRDGGWAYIAHPKTGERFVVRFVDWTLERQRLANLASNNGSIQGDFTEEVEAQLKALVKSPAFQQLKLDTLAQQLEVEFQGMRAGQVDDGLTESFSGAIDRQAETFSFTLNVPKKQARLFEDLPKPEAIDVLVKWLRREKRAGASQ